MPPTYWYGPHCEFVLTDSAELEEQTELSRMYHTELVSLRSQLRDAKAVSAVCINVFKGLQMLAEGKTTEKTFNGIVERSEKDMSRAADWLNEYAGTATQEIASLRSQLREMREAPQSSQPTLPPDTKTQENQ